MGTKTILGIFVAGAGAAVLLGLLAGDAAAAQEVSEGRKLYDVIMRWVNFGILAFVFWRYGKPALVNFLNGERNRVQKQLHEIEKDLNLAKQRMNEESEKLEGIDEYLQKVRTSIIEMGEREKERILKDARNRADQMIREAENEFDLKMNEARRFLNDRLAEKAVDAARNRLAEAFNEQDNEKQVEGFMGRLGAVKDEKELAL